MIGAISGGVLGNRIGKGKGRNLSTVGGGFAGNAIGKSGSRQSWTVCIRMGNGAITNIEVPDAQALRTCDLVEVEPNGNITRQS